MEKSTLTSAKKTFCAVLLAMLSTITATAYDFVKDGIYYEFIPNTSNVKVTYRTPLKATYSGDVDIPSKVTFAVVLSYTVTEIGDSAFSYSSGVTSVIIPNTVTTIGKGAFARCSSLKYVTIPNTVNTIGDYAFSGCSSLTSVTIPNSFTTTIGQYAFQNCSSLTSVNLPKYVTIGNHAFSGCSSLASVTIPNSVRTIDDGTFSGCSSLTSVTIPNSVSTIGDYAFRDCSSLTSVYIPNSVTTIGYGAFYDCSALASITIPNSVTSIGDYAFCRCILLTKATISNSLTHLGHSAFTQCPALQTFTGKYASSDGRCLIHNGNLAAFAPAGLTSYTIPNTAKKIDKYTFYYCRKLTSVTIPYTVSTIGYGAFEGCHKLTTLHLPSSLDEIGVNAFNACDAITEIYSKMKRPQTVKYNGPIFDSSIYDKATMYVPYPYGFNYMTTPFASIKNFKHIDYTRDLNGDNTINAADIETMVGSILKKPTQLTHEGETHTAVDLGLSVMWATTNVGSDKFSDPGNYYGWGECSPKSEYNIGNYLDIMGGEFASATELGTSKDPMQSFVYPNYKSISGTQFDAAHARWGGNWRMPTIDEWEELINRCNWIWQDHSLSGTPTKGYYVKGPNGYGIFLPLTGYMLNSNLKDMDNSSLNDKDENKGFYWTDMSSTSYAYRSAAVVFRNGSINADVNVETWLRTLGGVIRPVLDSPFDLNKDHQINSADINVVINAVLNK